MSAINTHACASVHVYEMLLGVETYTYTCISLWLRTNDACTGVGTPLYYNDNYHDNTHVAWAEIAGVVRICVPSADKCSLDTYYL